MARFDQPIEPMTLGNMRELGVRSSATRTMQREWRLPTSRQGGGGHLCLRDPGASVLFGEERKHPYFAAAATAR
jgi:hypothetical protein